MVNFEEYYNKMDDTKRDVNKQKKQKSDPVSQAFVNYLQKKNYPATAPGELSSEEFSVTMEVESESSRPNSIAYSAINSDPHVIDQNFGKFTSWIKEIRKRKPELQDLDLLVGPIFCHLYLEILQRDHTERASNFFKVHYPSIDQTKCCDLVKDLLNAIANDTLELYGYLKKTFRANKYVVNLSNHSIHTLRRFLQDNCQVVMFQVLLANFKIMEIDEEQDPEYDSEEDDALTDTEAKIMNGHAESQTVDPLKQKLLEAIVSLKHEVTPTFVASITNVKDDVTSGLINRQRGIVLYSYNSGIHVRSLLTLKQLDDMDDFTNEIIFREHSGKIYSFSMMTKENLFVSASHDTTLKLFDLSSYTLKNTYKGHTAPVYCVSTSPDGCYIASGSYDLCANLWTIDRTNILRLCAGHSQEITSIDFHPNSMYFSTGSADKAIRMWSIDEGSTVRLLLGSKGVVFCVAYSPCGKFLASSGEDKRLRIWELSTGKQLVEVKTSSEPIVKIIWSDDSTVIGAGTLDGIVRYWDFEMINKNPFDLNMQNPISTVTLGAKLLSMDYCFDTFGCFTTQSTKARIYQPDQDETLS